MELVPQPVLPNRSGNTKAVFGDKKVGAAIGVRGEAWK